MPIDAKQYDSAMDFIDDEAAFSRLLANLSNNDDRMRLKAYELYESMYQNRPEHIRITLRGGEDDEDEDSIEIYMPSAKKCIEAVGRFLAKDYSIQPDPSVAPSDSTPMVAAQLASLFKRERMPSKFANFKRFGLVKGDALFHLVGDKTKRPGNRLSIHELKPEHYFPIEDQVTGETTGCYIVDVIPNPKNSIQTNNFTAQTLARRQAYYKGYDDSGQPTGIIYSELKLFEVGKWDERVLDEKDISEVQEIKKKYALPSDIQHLPVYHWRNNPPIGSTFGMSELSGSETLVNAINQSMSDEDLTLIMQGLGVYWTDASPPLNSKGEEVEWEISPRSVVQVASGGQFGRVSGIQSVQPFGDHINALDKAMQQSLGIPDIAMGEVDDSTVAESGISRLLKFGPLLAKNAEKEADLTDVLDQFIYDIIAGWLPAYEGLDTEGAVFVTKFGNPLPKDKSKDLSDLMTIWQSVPGSVIPVSRFYQALNEIMGWDLDPTTDFEQALADAQRIMESTLPPAPEPAPGAEMAGAGAPSSNGKAH